MIELQSGLIDPVSAPPLVPMERPIDLEHLFRMTLGDHSLEREVLQLFARQSAMLMERIRDGELAVIAACAHTLKGSARGIGAWTVAKAAAALEAQATAGDGDLCKAVSALDAALADVRTAIRDLQRGH